MKERAALYGGTLTARAIHSTGLTDSSEGAGTSGGSGASGGSGPSGGAGASGSANVSGGEPAFSSGKVPSSAFGTATGFLVEARFPLKRGVEAQEASTEAHDIGARSEEHTSELQSRFDLVCRLLLENISRCAHWSCL